MFFTKSMYRSTMTISIKHIIMYSYVYQNKDSYKNKDNKMPIPYGPRRKHKVI